MNGLVTIVIIFLDAERFLAEAIDSLRQQTYSNWELVLVDDGSHDGGTGIARASAAVDPGRVRYLDHPGHRNLGTSVSRNTGLAAARGEHVLYLDADDILLPQALERLVDALDAHPEAGVAFGSTLFWFWAPDFAHKRDSAQPYERFHDEVVPPPRFLCAYLRYEIFHPANCSTLLRTGLLRQVGGFDAAFRGMYEDSAMLAKVLLTTPAYVTSEVLSAYRMHPSSQCHTAAAMGTYSDTVPNPDREHFLRWLAAHVERTNYRSARLAATLRHELWAYDQPLLYRSANMVAGARQALRAMLPQSGAAHDEAAAPSAPIAALAALERVYIEQGKPEEAAKVRGRLSDWVGAPS